MTSPLDDLAARVRAGDVRAVARAITVAERGGPDARALVARLFPHAGHAVVVGITGAPGSGKSTLVDRLVGVIRGTQATVAVVAIDPSSPFTGGAVLGDRVRMGAHARDEGVFIRSMATRGHLGGLSRATADAVTILDASGRRVIVVETVGVGQDEVDVMRLADVTVLVLVPGMGDDVQALKAGVMEIADVFVVNKADRPEADLMVAAVESTLALRPSEAPAWRPPVLKTEATGGVGVDAVWDAIERCRNQRPAGLEEARTRARHESRLREAVARLATDHVLARVDGSEWEAAVTDLVARRSDPDATADRLLTRSFNTHAGHTP
ncbi:MAG TPA: methylmalonyl Co-A mutase-associated GTPase MeaB [Vicinamibacterales bacterium]